jgi:hypothetical protein
MSGTLALLWKSAHRARLARAAALLGLALAAVIGLVGIESLRLARLFQAADSESAALQAALAEADARRALSADLRSREAQVRALRARGFTSGADRVAWAESVMRAAEALRPLRYKVEVGADAAVPLPADAQAWYDSRGLAAPRVVANELRLEAQGLHEDEIVALVARARESGGAVVRVEGCRISRRPDATGLDAVCHLRRLALLPAAVPGTTT